MNQVHYFPPGCRFFDFATDKWQVTGFFFLEEISPSDRATAGIIQDMSQYTSQLYKILPSGNLTFIVDFPIKNCDFP